MPSFWDAHILLIIDCDSGIKVNRSEKIDHNKLIADGNVLCYLDLFEFFIIFFFWKKTALRNFKLKSKLKIITKMVIKL